METSVDNNNTAPVRLWMNPAKVRYLTVNCIKEKADSYKPNFFLTMYVLLFIRNIVYRKENMVVVFFSRLGPFIWRRITAF